MELTGAQRRHLRRLAHPLKPVVQVGKEGVSENLVQAIREALEAHELIKLRLVDQKSRREELTRELSEATDSATVGRTGNVAILYRPHPEPEKRKIGPLPRAAQSRSAGKRE